MSLKIVHINREEIKKDARELADFLWDKWTARDKEAAQKKFPGVKLDDDDEPKKTA